MPSISVFPAGSTHEVLQPHRAQLEDELSVQKGEKVVVVCTSDDGWWMVRLVGGRGRNSLDGWTEERVRSGLDDWVVG